MVNNRDRFCLHVSFYTCMLTFYEYVISVWWRFRCYQRFANFKFLKCVMHVLSICTVATRWSLTWCWNVLIFTQIHWIFVFCWNVNVARANAVLQTTLLTLFGRHIVYLSEAICVVFFFQSRTNRNILLRILRRNYVYIHSRLCTKV